MSSTTPTNDDSIPEFFENDDIGHDEWEAILNDAAWKNYGKKRINARDARAATTSALIEELNKHNATKKLLRTKIKEHTATCVDLAKNGIQRGFMVTQGKIKLMRKYLALKEKRTTSIKNTLNYPPTPPKIPHPKFPRPGSKKRKRDGSPKKSKKKLSWEVRVYEQVEKKK